mmetsp:Transcript_12/g.16  ORF Transcript_12/g.16 Transcript_12/m.16 type:complete len:205 (+) Transcript_12:402-1016(+)
MVELAKGKAEKENLSNIEHSVASINDLSAFESGSQDVVTSNFGLMFTEDLPGALAEIHRVLRPGGHMVATVWEQNSLMTVCGATMVYLLGEAPPPPPLNPLSMKDPDVVDPKLSAAGFLPAVGHNSTLPLDFVMDASDPKTYKVICLPIKPKIDELQEAAEEGVDVYADAQRDVKEFCESEQFIDSGNLCISGIYRILLVSKPA